MIEFDINKKVKLNNNTEIPVIGFGTWQIPNDIAQTAVKDAINTGYTHIDTAAVYKNEEGVGNGIKLSNIKRDNLFITTKIDGNVKTYKGAKKSIEDSLKKLGVDYIDLVLIHCPQPWLLYSLGFKGFKRANINVYRAMEEAYEEGKIKSLGVSNFRISDLKNLLDNCHIKPQVNQIQWAIDYKDEDLRDYCHKNDIIVEGFSPLGTGKLLKNKTIIEMAKKYNVNPANLCLKYALKEVDVVIFKTIHKEYMEINKNLNFDISSSDYEILKQISK